MNALDLEDEGHPVAELEAVVTRPQFLLIEGEWRVQLMNDMVQISLTTLRPPRGYDPREPNRARPMPPGASIVATFPGSDVVTSRRSRLVHDAVIRAGVFATVVAYRSELGSLGLGPLTVFARHGTRELEFGPSWR